MSFNFSKCQSVLVTGASKGLGLQMVKELAKSNQRPKTIIATARNPSPSEDLQELNSYPGFYIVPLDATSQPSISTALQEVMSIVGEDGLNCLIINVSADLKTVTPEVMMKTFESNTVAPFVRHQGISAPASEGRDQMDGDPQRFKTYAYRTSKAALNMVTRCLATDLEAGGILCMALHPGWVRTDMGGPNADLSVEESTSSVLAVVADLTEEDHGGFAD